MKIIEKLLDVFKLQGTREMENEGHISAIETKEDNACNSYYKNISKQKENNLKIEYEDVKHYDLRPFDLDKPFISDGHFTAIELEGENLDKAYRYLRNINEILAPFKYLFKSAVFPDKIGTDYWIWNPKNHLPISHLRLSPYTATRRNNKYPCWLWLSHCNDCGAEYIYMIYFNQNGEIGKADLSLHGSSGARLSYESKIRRNENGLYVMRINKTLYVEPYGTKILYHYEDDPNFAKPEKCAHIETKGNEKNQESKNKKHTRKESRMNKYDLERYAIMCNAHMEHEEEMKQYE